MARKGVKEVESWQHLAVIVPISNHFFLHFFFARFKCVSGGESVLVLVSVCVSGQWLVCVLRLSFYFVAFQLPFLLRFSSVFVNLFGYAATLLSEIDGSKKKRFKKNINKKIYYFMALVFCALKPAAANNNSNIGIRACGSHVSLLPKTSNKIPKINKKK